MVEYKPENIIARLRQTVNTGRFGIDYTICRRDKNNLLREKYIIDDSKIKNILINLSVDDYISSEPSDNEEFPDDIVHKFISFLIIPNILLLYHIFTVYLVKSD